MNRSCLVLLSCLSCLIASQLRAQDTVRGVPRGTKLYTWECVGEVVAVSGKTFAIRRSLRISDASWSLEPGAVSGLPDLNKGDQIVAKGKTQSDGSFETSRIFMISPATTVQPTGSGASSAHGADFGGPEARAGRIPDGQGEMSPEGRGRVPTVGSRLPPPGVPGGGAPKPGGLQNSRGAGLPKFAAGDAEGVIERVSDGRLSLIQTFFIDKKTEVHLPDGTPAKPGQIKIGNRLAVTAKDELDEKTQTVKAQAVRIMP